jgi:hypothetical protein
MECSLVSLFLLSEPGAGGQGLDGTKAGLPSYADWAVTCSLTLFSSSASASTTSTSIHVEYVRQSRYQRVCPSFPSALASRRLSDRSLFRV